VQYTFQAIEIGEQVVLGCQKPAGSLLIQCLGTLVAMPGERTSREISAPRGA